MDTQKTINGLENQINQLPSNASQADGALLRIFHHNCFKELAQSRPASIVSLLGKLTGKALSHDITENIRRILAAYSLFYKIGPSPQVLLIGSDNAKGVLLPKILVASSAILCPQGSASLEESSDSIEKMATLLLDTPESLSNHTQSEALNVASFGAKYRLPALEFLGSKRLIDLLNIEAKKPNSQAKIANFLQLTCKQRIWSASLAMLAALNPGVGFGRRDQTLLILVPPGRKNALVPFEICQHLSHLQPRALEWRGHFSAIESKEFLPLISAVAELRLVECEVDALTLLQQSAKKVVIEDDWVDLGSEGHTQPPEEWYFVPSRKSIEEYSIRDKTLTKESGLPEVDSLLGRISKKIFDIGATVASGPVFAAAILKHLFTNTDEVQALKSATFGVGLPIITGVRVILGAPVAAVYGSYRVADLLVRLGYHTTRKLMTPNYTIAPTRQSPSLKSESER